MEDEISRQLVGFYHDLMGTLLDRRELFARMLTEKVAEVVPSHGIVMVLDSEEHGAEPSGFENVAHVHVGRGLENLEPSSVRLEQMERGKDLFARLVSNSMEELKDAMRHRYPDHTAMHTHWLEVDAMPRLALCICRVDLPDALIGPFADQDLRTLNTISPHLIVCARMYAEITRISRTSFDFFALRCEELAAQFELTSSEYRVLRLMVGGATNKEVSDELGVSLATVKTHISHIMQKTGCRNRSDLIGKHFASKNITVPR